jgi:hypothetical protein
MYSPCIAAALLKIRRLGATRTTRPDFAVNRDHWSSLVSESYRNGGPIVYEPKAKSLAGVPGLVADHHRQKPFRLNAHSVLTVLLVPLDRA